MIPFLTSMTPLLCPIRNRLTFWTLLNPLETFEKNTEKWLVGFFLQNTSNVQLQLPAFCRKLKLHLLILGNLLFHRSWEHGILQSSDMVKTYSASLALLACNSKVYSPILSSSSTLVLDDVYVGYDIVFVVAGRACWAWGEL